MDSGLCGKHLGMCCSWKKVLLSAVSFWLCSTECDSFRHFSFHGLSMGIAGLSMGIAATPAIVPQTHCQYFNNIKKESGY